MEGIYSYRLNHKHILDQQKIIKSDGNNFPKQHQQELQDQHLNS